MVNMHSGFRAIKNNDVFVIQVLYRYYGVFIQ